ncbi:MAG: hypothetical protein QM702_06660 [Rubrivivax sp.]
MNRKGSRPHWDGWLTLATIVLAVASAWIWADPETDPAASPVTVR